jgi:hypothetical protein
MHVNIKASFVNINVVLTKRSINGSAVFSTVHALMCSCVLNTIYCYSAVQVLQCNLIVTKYVYMCCAVFVTTTHSPLSNHSACFTAQACAVIAQPTCQTLMILLLKHRKIVQKMLHKLSSANFNTDLPHRVSVFATASAALCYRLCIAPCSVIDSYSTTVHANCQEARVTRRKVQ